MDLKQRAVTLLKAWHKGKASSINHAAVVRSIYQEMELSTGYLLVLTIANLIALTGLLTNNTAIIIGAMLISPLMGPILSSGFAFTTGNAVIGRKALTTVAISVTVTIAVAAAATLISPLDSATGEILARTRPNLYDLVVAFLAGIVGSIAICSKRNYITIVPGVAIATAVIPPLSVAGYGIGSWQPMIALGGFFLFFTNFVAIIISTCIVFLAYGFRPGMTAGTEVSVLRHRIIVLSLILFVISLPLLYTLHSSLSEVRLRGSISSSLKKSFEKENLSHLSRFEFRSGSDAVRIKAAIQTTSYLGTEDILKAEQDLAHALGKKASLDVEQVLMQAGGFRHAAASPGIAVKHGPDQTYSGIEAAVSPMNEAISRVEKIIEPYRVSGFYLGKKEGSQALHGIIRVRKDTPLTAGEQKWLERIVSEAVGAKVELAVETVPLLDPLIINGNDAYGSEEVKKALAVAGAAYNMQPSSLVIIETHQYLSDKASARRKLAVKRAEPIRAALVKEQNIPAGNIKVLIAPGTSGKPAVVIRVKGD